MNYLKNICNICRNICSDITVDSFRVRVGESNVVVVPISSGVVREILLSLLPSRHQLTRCKRYVLRQSPDVSE